MEIIKWIDPDTLELAGRKPLFAYALAAEEVGLHKQAADIKMRRDGVWTANANATRQNFQASFIGIDVFGLHLRQLGVLCQPSAPFLGPNNSAPPNIQTLGLGIDIDIRSRALGDWVVAINRGAEPVVFYRADRRDHLEKIMDSTVVVTIDHDRDRDPDFPTIAAFWGSIPRDPLIALLDELPSHRRSQDGSSEFIAIPWEHFPVDELQALMDKLVNGSGRSNAT